MRTTHFADAVLCPHGALVMSGDAHPRFVNYDHPALIHGGQFKELRVWFQTDTRRNAESKGD